LDLLEDNAIGTVTVTEWNRSNGKKDIEFQVSTVHHYYQSLLLTN